MPANWTATYIKPDHPQNFPVGRHAHVTGSSTDSAAYSFARGSHLSSSAQDKYGNSWAVQIKATDVLLWYVQLLGLSLHDDVSPPASKIRFDGAGQK